MKAKNSLWIRIETGLFYSVTDSMGATQRFSTNQETSSEQKNRSSFILDQSHMADLYCEKFISINEKATKYLLKGAMKNVGWLVEFVTL